MKRQFAIVIMCLVLLVVPTHAEKRVALVIGNDAYSNQIEEAQLKKAVNDASAVRDTLAKLGFEVIFRKNATQDEFKTAVFEFSRKISKGDIALFFYAGHGAALKGTNYFLPSNVPKIDPSSLKSEADIEAKVSELAEFSVREAFVLEHISKNEPKVSLLVMDACRDNPLRNPSGDNPFRSFSRGGVQLGDDFSVTEKPQPEGMILVYSASFGQRALDRLSETETDPNSPFTRAFLKNLSNPNFGLKQVLASTKEEVFAQAKSINHKQTPAIYDQLFGGDVFLSGKQKTESKAILLDAPATDEVKKDEAKLAYDAAGNDPALLQLVVQNFGGSIWAKFAKSRLDLVLAKPLPKEPIVENGESAPIAKIETVKLPPPNPPKEPGEEGGQNGSVEKLETPNQLPEPRIKIPKTTKPKAKERTNTSEPWEENRIKNKKKSKPEKPFPKAVQIEKAKKTPPIAPKAKPVAPQKVVGETSLPRCGSKFHRPGERCRRADGKTCRVSNMRTAGLQLDGPGFSGCR